MEEGRGGLAFALQEDDVEALVEAAAGGARLRLLVGAGLEDHVLRVHVEEHDVLVALKHAPNRSRKGGRKGKRTLTASAMLWSCRMQPGRAELWLETTWKEARGSAFRFGDECSESEAPESEPDDESQATEPL